MQIAGVTEVLGPAPSSCPHSDGLHHLSVLHLSIVRRLFPAALFKHNCIKSSVSDQVSPRPKPYLDVATQGMKEPRAVHRIFPDVRDVTVCRRLLAITCPANLSRIP